MRRIYGVLASVIVMLVLLSLAACAGSAIDASDSREPQVQEEPAVQDAASSEGADDEDSSHVDEFYDDTTGQWIAYDDVTQIHTLCEVDEYDQERGEHEYPTRMSAELAGDLSIAEDAITDPDVIGDLWYRIMRMRLLLRDAKTDSGNRATESLTFFWEDGRMQTYTFTGSWSLVYDGSIYPVFEQETAAGDDFSTPVVQPLENYFYPGVVFDAIKGLTGNSSADSPIFVVAYGTSSIRYQRDTFLWDADAEGPAETFSVTYRAGTGDASGGIQLHDVWYDQYSCFIEGARQLKKITITDTSEGTSALVVYVAEGSGDTKQCSLACANGVLEVKYL